MAIYTKVYQMLEDLKQRIIKTMQERGLTKIDLVPSEEEWLKENPENDKFDYYDMKNWSAPSVIYFDKYGMGVNYNAVKATLCKSKSGEPYFELECEGSEDNDTFSEYDLTTMSMLNVCDALEDILEL